jgi:hypothetical protein
VQKVKAHKRAVGKFTLRIQQLSAMVARLLVQTSTERVTAPEQLGTFKDLLDSSKTSIEVGGDGGWWHGSVGRGERRTTFGGSGEGHGGGGGKKAAGQTSSIGVGVGWSLALHSVHPRHDHVHGLSTWVQVFTNRGFLSKLLLASGDLDKIQELDGRLTKCLNDMQVGGGARLCTHTHAHAYTEARCMADGEAGHSCARTTGVP